MSLALFLRVANDPVDQAKSSILKGAAGDKESCYSNPDNISQDELYDRTSWIPLLRY